MKCEGCNYFWKSEDDDYPVCHYEGPDGTAPCEEDEDEV